MLSEKGERLLNLASDLDDAQKSQNWFAVNGVKNTLIEMAKEEGAEEPDGLN